MPTPASPNQTEQDERENYFFPKVFRKICLYVNSTQLFVPRLIVFVIALQETKKELKER